MVAQFLARVRRWWKPSSGTAERSHLPYYRHDVTAPPSILEGLRRVDPTADLLYLGWGKWMLVSVRPHREMIAKGYGRLQSAKRLLHRWETDHVLKANPGAFRRLYQRYLYWLAVTQGARPICEYNWRFVRAFGLEAIVADFRRMDWMHRRATEGQVFDDNNAEFGLDYEKARARREADADLREEAKAIHVWDFLDKRPHSDTRKASPDPRRHGSASTIVATIAPGAGGSLRSTG